MRLASSLVLMFACLSAICHAAADTPNDSGLAQPVTIECTNARLHTVVEQLSEQSGVAIRCGRDSRDWQVRDIPVTVCAKDIPLGLLLKSIAASTHLLLSKEQAGQTTIYRIWRDSKRRKELDDFFKAKDTADMAGIAWNWDAACKLKDVPDSEGAKDRQEGLMSNLGGVLSSLGADDRDKVLSGGYTKCAFANSPKTVQECMSKMLQGLMPVFKSSAPSLTADDLQKSGMTIYLDRNDLGILNAWVACGVNIVDPQTGDISKSFICRFPVDLPVASRQKLADMREYPAEPSKPEFQTPDGDWKKLTYGSGWDLPVLQTKVSLEAPKDKDAITVGSLLAALSKASGFAVVCEDFASHRSIPSPASLFGKETTIKSVLQGLDHTSIKLPQADFVWYINEKEKVILGTSDKWPFHHINLVSEGLLAYLRDRLDGDGVGLDDYLKVLALERGQVDEWIRYSEDIQILEAYGRPEHKEFWMLYDSLSPQHKAQAQTESGLPLRNLQPAYIAYLILRYNQNEADKVHHHPLSTSEPKEFPYDDQSIASLVMKVKKENKPQSRMSWSRGTAESEEVTNWPMGPYMVDSYEMTIEITQNGETRALSLDGPKGLPFRSPKREKALGIKPAEQ